MTDRSAPRRVADGGIENWFVEKRFGRDVCLRDKLPKVGVLFVAEFDKYCDEPPSLWRRMEAAVANVIEDQSFGWDAVHHVLLAGGSVLLRPWGFILVSLKDR